MPRPSSEITIPESVWEQHKKVIWDLYIKQNSKKKNVMEIMETEHGFNATEWQFEEHFRKWKFRKNFRADEWKAIQNHILKRKNAGRPDSDVYDNGLLVPRKKVQKGTYRNGTVSTIERFTKCPSPKLPAGVVVCTPPALVVQWPMTDNLPWASFDRLFTSRAVQFQPKDFNQILTAEVSVSRQSTAGLDFAMQIFPRSNCHLRKARETKKELALMLQSTKPELHPGEHLSTAYALSKSINHDSIPALARMLVYALSNHLVQPDNAQKCYMLAKDTGIVQTILSIPGSTSESLAEALIPLAIDDESTAVMELLLRHVGISQIVLNKSLRPHTLLQYALSNGKRRMISLLLEKGARIDFPQETDTYHAFSILRQCKASEAGFFLGNIGGDMGAIRKAVTDGLNQGKEYAVVLLSIGDNINAIDQEGKSLLHHVASDSCPKLIRLLLLLHADFDLKDKRGWTALHHATQGARRRSHAALRTIETLLDHGADVNLTNSDGYTLLTMPFGKKTKS